MRLQSVPNKMEHGGYMRVSPAVMKDHIQKQLGEERMLFGSHFHITVIFQGGQDRNSNSRNLEPANDAEAMEGCCWREHTGLSAEE